MLLELGEPRRRPVDAGRVGAADHGRPSTRRRTRCTVRVWSVLVVAAPGAGRARQVWRTVTLDLVDASTGVWLVDGWASTPGPTPAPPPEAPIVDAAAIVAPLAGRRHGRRGGAG